MRNKKPTGLKIYIIIMIAANLVLAFLIGRAFITEKLPNASLSHTNGKETAEHTAAADQRNDRPKVGSSQGFNLGGKNRHSWYSTGYADFFSFRSNRRCKFAYAIPNDF